MRVFVMGIVENPVLKLCSREPVYGLCIFENSYSKPSKAVFQCCIVMINSVNEQGTGRPFRIGPVLEILCKSVSFVQSTKTDGTRRRNGSLKSKV
jgi:hypothetical protein